MIREEQFKKKYRNNVCKRCSYKYPCSHPNPDEPNTQARCDKVVICEECEIKNTCTSLCDMMDGFINRGEFLATPQFDKMCFFSSSFEDLDDIIEVKEKKAVVKQENGVTYLEFKIEKLDLKLNLGDIHWEAVSPLMEKRVKLHFLEGLTYKQIAKSEKREGHDGRIYVSVKKALKKLARKYNEKIFYKNLKEKENVPFLFSKFLDEYYFNRLRVNEIAHKYKKTKRRIYQAIQFLRNKMEVRRK